MIYFLLFSAALALFYLLLYFFFLTITGKKYSPEDIAAVFLIASLAILVFTAGRESNKGSGEDSEPPAHYDPGAVNYTPVIRAVNYE